MLTGFKRRDQGKQWAEEKSQPQSHLHLVRAYTREIQPKLVSKGQLPAHAARQDTEVTHKQEDSVVTWP